MAFEERHLIWKAIAGLDELCAQAYQGPIPPTFALRFILAYLYAHSDGNRAPYDGFWKACQDKLPDRTQASYIRGTTTRTEWNGIVRGLGIAQTIEFHNALARERRGVVRANDRS